MASPKADLVEAVGSLIHADPARIVALASSLRGPDRTFESTVEGMSMGRTLPPGSRIQIALIHRARYKIGEVIAFLDGTQVIVHRVVHCGRFGAAAGYILTMGDATLVPDPPLNNAQILGPVSCVWKESRWVPLLDAPWRSMRARIARSILLAAASCLLKASPRATTVFLVLLNRVARDVRSALNPRIREQGRSHSKAR